MAKKRQRGALPRCFVCRNFNDQILDLRERHCKPMPSQDSYAGVRTNLTKSEILGTGDVFRRRLLMESVKNAITSTGQMLVGRRRILESVGRLSEFAA